MDFIRRLGSFWVILVACGIFGYFSLFNLDFIYVNIPHVAEFKVRAAVAFMCAFLTGASVVIVFFGIDVLKKSFLLRQKNRKIAELERRLARHENTKPAESPLDLNPSITPENVLD